MNLQYLVVGTGRCGTLFLAKFLTSIGIPCGHESIFTLGGFETVLKRIHGLENITMSGISLSKGESEWTDPQFIVADSSYMAAPFLDRPILATTKVIHVVRNPIEVINSYCNHIFHFKYAMPVQTFSMQYEKFNYNNIPELKQEMPMYDRAALFYIRWNRMIEDKLAGRSHLFVRIEKDLRSVLAYVGQPRPNYSKLFQDSKANTYEKPGIEKFTFDMIQSDYIKSELQEVAKNYGYELENMTT